WCASAPGSVGSRPPGQRALRVSSSSHLISTHRRACIGAPLNTTGAGGPYSRAMGKWTATDVPDQTGRVVVITGANSGLGLRSAEALASKGARVLMACRNREKAEAARAEVAAVATGPAPEV